MHSVTNKTKVPNVRGQNRYIEYIRIMLLLKLYWTYTIWKAQGITVLIKAVVSLIDRKREYSLSHATLSRMTKITNLGIKDIKGLSKNRLCAKRYKYPKMSKYLEEENRL